MKIRTGPNFQKINLCFFKDDLHDDDDWNVIKYVNNEQSDTTVTLDDLFLMSRDVGSVLLSLFSRRDVRTVCSFPENERATARRTHGAPAELSPRTMRGGAKKSNDG